MSVSKPLQLAMQSLQVVRDLPIRLIGDPILYKKCTKISIRDFGSKKLQDESDLLVKTLKDYRNHMALGRGIAANQIGFSNRMIAVWTEREPTVMCNPTIRSNSGRGTYMESCLSSGAVLIGQVKRPWVAKFSYQDTDGKLHNLDTDPIKTRIILHEIDHLNGVLCIDRYKPKTMKIVKGDQNEFLKAKLKRIK